MYYYELWNHLPRKKENKDIAEITVSRKSFDSIGPQRHFQYKKAFLDMTYRSVCTKFQVSIVFGLVIQISDEIQENGSWQQVATMIWFSVLRFKFTEKNGLFIVFIDSLYLQESVVQRKNISKNSSKVLKIFHLKFWRHRKILIPNFSI